MLNLVKKYEIKKILYSKSQFSKFKYEYNQKYIYNKNINERINEIKLYGKNLLILILIKIKILEFLQLSNQFPF